MTTMTETRIQQLLESYASDYHATHFIRPRSLLMGDGDQPTEWYKNSILKLDSHAADIAYEIMNAIHQAGEDYLCEIEQAIQDKHDAEDHD